ncbi:MAG: lytic transglycosylase domain-containing protein [Hyphomicrobiaceae bacterium]|nr:lytic transglycosylase domain-containing protein [Hyphomicrobiaceae bacterium]MCC0024461.1 lytic transglycosylase domain-containing protein [Hyphomicrobiaceae bacterium]
MLITSRLLALIMLVAALWAPAGPVMAETGDITGSTNANGAVSTPVYSPQFADALSLIENGKYADAYQLARGFVSTPERRAIQWAAIYYGKGEIDFDSVKRFEADAPDMATQTLYRTRIEQSIIKLDPGPGQVIALLGGQMPVLTDAQIALARAYVADGQVDRGFGIAAQVWTTQFLDRDQEAIILREFAPKFRNALNWRRAIHLLMNDRASAVERMWGLLTPAQQSLAQARIAVARNQGNASTLLSQVDPSLRDDPLFYYSQGQLARRSGNLVGAVAYFNKVGDRDLPDSEEWWYERRYLARKLMESGHYREAYAVTAAYNTGPEGRVVDANFHAGWIALEFLNDPAAAARHFERMASLSTLESSITKSYYWLGRAMAKLGDDRGAAAAFAKAAAYPTSYYGVLSLYRLGQTDFHMRPLPDSSGRLAIFENRQLVQIAHLFAAAGHPKLAEPLVTRLIYSVTDPGDMVLTARLAQSLDAHNLAVLMADVAEQRGVALDLFNFPRDGVPSAHELTGIDPAAVYAIARQESHFDFDVVSAAGARGLMQLMPSTAEETARALGVAYSLQRLTADPEYNALLGSSYLRRQLSRYGNSLVLAAAAYNGGAGNVNKWIDLYGNPTNPAIDPVVWIEQIPFAETRNYVQRVVANFILYRARLGLPKMNVAQVLRSI